MDDPYENAAEQGRKELDESVVAGREQSHELRRLTERKRQEEFRNWFIANAAHELRTPLATLTGFVDLLAAAGPGLGEEQYRQAIDAMQRAGRRATTLVNNLLDLSRIQEGRLTIHARRVVVDELLRQVADVHPPAEGRTVTFDVVGDPVVEGDRDRLEQAVANLLSNAYRYGGRNIVLGARPEGRDVIVSVADDGSGVEEQLIPQLFEPFARGSQASVAGGSGLGLAIVKIVIEASGGEIYYEPNEPRGSRFCMRLPAAP